MKIDFFSLTVVVICIAAAPSSPFPNWMDPIQDLNMKRLLELQDEDVGSDSPPRLRCFICNEDSDCATEEELETCEPGFNCSTVTARNESDITVIKVCLPPGLCSSDFVCNNLNRTGDVESCNVDCCGIDECNAEPPPTIEPATAELTTEPPPPPTTTPAPRIYPLRGNNRVFRSPGFLDGSYEPNLDITWFIPGSNMRGLVLDFLIIDTERGRDIITIRQGNTVVRTLSGVFRQSRGKRSMSIPFYQEDDLCDEDDDEAGDGYFGYDIPYARLAAAYERYRRQRTPRAPCVYVRGSDVTINFSSDGNDTGQRGFSARFRVLFRGRGDDK